MLRSTPQQERASWLLMRWLTYRDQTARWAAGTGYFPVRISASTHPSMTAKLASDSQYAQAYALLPLGRVEPNVNGWQDARYEIEKAMRSVLYAGQPVTSTLDTAAANVDAILAQRGGKAMVVTPGGGTLAYTSTHNLSVTIVFPAGALAITQTVTYMSLNDLPTDGLAFALVPNLTFSQPVTITIHYRDSDIEGMKESQLKLYNYDWPSHTWVEAAPCGGYARDPANNILRAVVCHFSDYGLMDWPYIIYLPLTLRNL